MFESNHSNLDPEPVIPVELIRNIFIWASVDLPTISPLNFLLVCRKSHSWILPLLYHSVKFTKADQLSKFLSSHDIPNDHMETRFRLIQDMYIGPTPSDPGDLQYSSTNWPVTVISRILWLSTSLQNLTILNLDQNKWHTLEHAIPSSLRNLTLGPVHGAFRVQNLRQRPQLVQFTSVSTYMRDDEVRDIVCYPSLRKLRRILQAMSMGPAWAFVQLACISKTRTLEALELVICGKPERTTPVRVLARGYLDQLIDDERVVVWEDKRDWLAIVFDDYEKYRVDFVVSQM